jgi:hypothetical protein
MSASLIAKTALIVGAALAASLAWAQKPIAYPAKGQSQQQQSQDDQNCYSWARSNTGIDPAAPAPQSTGTTLGSGHRARGAVGGAVIGGIADGSDGARTGAAVGAVVGGSRARRERRAQNESAQQGSQDTFYRAYAACMEGRGYSIR